MTLLLHEYGCTLCQKFHREWEAIYREHLYFQSKHGYYQRAPVNSAERTALIFHQAMKSEFRALSRGEAHDGRCPHCGFLICECR